MRSKKLFSVITFFALVALVLSACQQYSKTKEITANPQIEKAVCMLHPTAGNDVTGVVDFTKTDSGIYIVANVYGLSKGKHGFHIHEYGDCTAPDGKSAGGHFNPEHVAHGGPNDSIRHAGDLGNLVADSTGSAHLEMVDTLISFTGRHSIIGRGIIVHAGADDFVSQPTGNAGGRVACGVIGIEQETD